MPEPVIVGLSALHHDSAVCVLRGGRLVAAAEEERFSRRKHHGGIPAHAFRSCLAEAEVTIEGIDAVAVGLDPVALADRRAAFGLAGSHTDLEREVRRVLGVEAPIEFVAHHEAHAASAFLVSPMPEAAVLVVDGVGEWATTSISRGRGTELEELDRVDFPHSLGLFYAAVTQWLGFRVNHDEYKVMGLAAWAPDHADPVGALDAVVPVVDGDSFELDLEYFAFLDGARMYSDRFVDVFGPPRAADRPIEDHHVAVAGAAQRLLEDRVLHLARRARRLTGSTRLGTAGGVMLNAVANGKLQASGIFDRVWFQPVAGDAGTALGAAAKVAADRTGERPAVLTDLRLGPLPGSLDPDAVSDVLPQATIADHRDAEEALVAAVAELVGSGAIVAWCHGRMEFGPRALGARSLLADPRDASTRDRINAIVKERERWRPLAPVVGAWAAADLFYSARPRPFMIEAVPARRPDALAAAVHVDGTSRPQTVDPAAMGRMGALLQAVEERLGVAALVNTSFNHASEPIVATAAEAILSAVRLGVDAVVVDDLLITDLPRSLGDHVAAWQAPPSAPPIDNLYPL